MPQPSIPVAEAARFLEVPEEEARKLADAEGNVPLETVRSRSGAASIARDLAAAREEIGRLSGQLKEVRASNVRLQKELRDSVEERRRLTAEERLMLMERIEHIAHVEQELEESSSEVERLKNRRLLDRLLNR